MLMNHDYTHCVDWDDRYCPESCFRAQLSKDIREHLLDYLDMPMGWASFKGTKYCELDKENKR